MGSLSDYGVGAGTSVASTTALASIPTAGLRRGDLAAVDLTDPQGFEYYAFDPTSLLAVSADVVLADIALNSAANAGRWLRLTITEAGESPYYARNVKLTAVADLNALTVASSDGITNVEGDIIVLAAQAVAAQNGPYRVGVVTAGVAPLTRPSWWRTGSRQQVGATIVIADGTVYANTKWFVGATVNGPTSIVVDTDNPLLVPESVTQVVGPLVAGAATISNVPTLPAGTAVGVVITSTTRVPGAGNLTVQYNPVTITGGALGTASIVINAQKNDGTLSNLDLSTLRVTIINR